MITYGMLNEEIGRGCSSVRSLLTVHDMACQGILRWGNRAQKDRWLAAAGQGGDPRRLRPLRARRRQRRQGRSRPRAVLDGDSYVLNGTKKWITYGQIADLFLLFAQFEGKPTAFLVERDSPGFSFKPIRGLLGTRASMLAELVLEDVRVPAEALVGRPGFGVSHVVGAALEQGRYSVACGSVGIAQACLEACLQLLPGSASSSAVRSSTTSSSARCCPT